MSQKNFSDQCSNSAFQLQKTQKKYKYKNKKFRRAKLLAVVSCAQIVKLLGEVKRLIPKYLSGNLVIYAIPTPLY